MAAEQRRVVRAYVDRKVFSFASLKRIKALIGEADKRLESSGHLLGDFKFLNITAFINEGL